MNTKKIANMPMPAPQPEPEPALKVGDWVEHRESKEQARIVHIASVEYDGITIKFSYSNETEIYSTREFNIEFRKLKPSGVVIHIGCLSGTVRPVSTNGIHIWFHLIGANDKTIATIRISCLDIHTREMVERLLKAQEEE